MYSFIFSTSFFPSWYLSFTWCVFSSAFGAWEHVSSLEHWLCRFWRTWFIPSEGLRDVLTFWRRRLKKHGVYNRGFRGPSHQKNRSIPCESRVCFQHVSTFQAHSEHKHGLDSFAWSIWVSYEHYIICIISKAKSCTCIHACERGCIKDQWQWQAMSSN